MNKIILIIMAIFLFFAGSIGTIGCSSQLEKPKDIKSALVTKIGEANVEDTSVAELMISQKMVWFMAPLVLALFASIILIFLGARLIGLGVLISSITCIIVVVAMSVYMELVAIIGIIVLLVGIYFLFREISRKSITEKDMFNSVEMAKTLISDENKEKLKKTLNNIQSKYTRETVSKIKK